MARMRCSKCGKPLNYVIRKGAIRKIPVWAHYVDADIKEHKLHLKCAEGLGKLETYYGQIGEPQNG